MFIGFPDGKRFYWLGLTILFLFLAIDEGTAIHEEIGTFLERYMNAKGALYFLWVVPYGVATLVFALAGHFAGVPDFLMFAGWAVLGLTQRLVIRKISSYRRFVLLRRVRVRERLVAVTAGN